MTATLDEKARSAAYDAFWEKKRENPVPATKFAIDAAITTYVQILGGVHKFTGNGPGVVGADNCQVCGRWSDDPETLMCKN